MSAWADSDVTDVTAFVAWLLDQGSVCVEHSWPNPVTIDLGNGWVVVPEEFHAFVLAYEHAVWGEADV